METAGEIRKRSTFVTVLAWIFIVLAGWGTLIGIFQNVMFHTVMPDMSETVRQTNESGQIVPVYPGSGNFMMDYGGYFFLAMPILSAILLVASIGLLKRRNWGRKIIIVLLGLGICWSIFGYFLVPSPPDAQDAFPADFYRAFKMMQVFSIIMSIVFVVGFGLIIRKLVSKDIRQEFVKG